MQRLLITGISSFLGSYIADWLPTGWRAVGTYLTHREDTGDIPSYRIDLTERSQVDLVLKKVKPDAILHLAAASNPNFCEQNPAISKAVNVTATTQLAEYCQARQIPLIFTSTDLVFSGENAPYKETTTPAPLSIYGQHKWEAEQAILDRHPQATIARMPLLYGDARYGKNFFTDWVKKLETGQVIGAFTDEFRTPVDGESAARGLLQLLLRQAEGIWHLGGQESLSRYDFAFQLAVAMELPTSLLRPALRTQVPMPAPRPENVSLNSEKAFAQGYEPKKVGAFFKEFVY